MGYASITSLMERPIARLVRRVTALGLCCFCLVSPVGATTNNVDTSLISEVNTIAPGVPFWLGFKQVIRPGWHTYWRNPGDSGAATKLHWDLPEGFSHADIQWPFPERIPYGPLVNLGYHDEVLLLVEITPPPDLPLGKVTINARAEWLVCEDICIPEDADLSLTLPVSLRPPLKNEAFSAARQKIPQTLPVKAGVRFRGDKILLGIEIPGIDESRIREVAYFPYEEGVIDYTEPQSTSFSESGFSVELAQGWDFDPLTASYEGIVVITEEVPAPLQTAFVVAPLTTTGSEIGFLTAVLFAFLGGMILNLMPCVFPVLSIKILSVIDSVAGDQGAIRVHGLVYLFGVVVSFVVIAAVLLTLRAAGEQIGWGFQLQSPLVVGVLVYLFMTIGLSLSGYFEIGLSWTGFGHALTRHGGLAGSFFTGVLATVVAAPCTAPFMGAAIGFAVTQSSVDALIVFASLGTGMGAPYLALCFSPALIKRLPRPGHWMVTFKELLAFPMFASAIWLIWVLSLQTGSDGVFIILVGVLLIGFGLWFSRIPNRKGSKVMAGLLLLAAASLLLQLKSTEQAVQASSERILESVPYSATVLAEARTRGPVFVNFTAAWCITCKVNELAALRSEAIKTTFEKRGITYLKGDWTNEDPAITAALARFGRSGVPLYLLYPKGDSDALVLPQILTPDIVIDAIEAL